MLMAILPLLLLIMALRRCHIAIIFVDGAMLILLLLLLLPLYAMLMLRAIFDIDAFATLIFSLAAAFMIRRHAFRHAFFSLYAAAMRVTTTHHVIRHATMPRYAFAIDA